MTAQTKLLTESGVSFALFQHWVLNPNCKASDWIALLELAQQGYVVLGPNKIRLTSKGAKLLINDEGDPIFADVMSTIFDSTEATPGREVVFNGRKPSSGFVFSPCSVCDSMGRDWLVKKGVLKLAPFWCKQRIYPLILLAVVIGLFAAMATQVWQLWFFVAILAVMLIQVLASAGYVPSELGKEMAQVYKNFRVKTVDDMAYLVKQDANLLPWVLHKGCDLDALQPGDKLFQLLCLLELEPDWWVGSYETMIVDLPELLKRVAEAYPAPPPAVYNGTASAGA